MLNERDRKLLLRLKDKIISRCVLCQGKNVSCSCIDTFRLEFRKVKANIPPKYRDVAFEQITHPETVVTRGRLKNYIDNLEQNHLMGTGLFLFGSTGLAKTYLACTVLVEALRQKRSGHFSTLDHCISLYTAGWKEPAAKEVYNDLIIEPDFLVLDEVGNEPRTNLQLVRTVLNDLLRRRHNNQLPTIITSNLLFNEKNLINIYGDEVWSILSESVIPLEFKGIDFRQGVLKEVI